MSATAPRTPRCCRAGLVPFVRLLVFSSCLFAQAVVTQPQKPDQTVAPSELRPCIRPASILLPSWIVRSGIGDWPQTGLGEMSNRRTSGIAGGSDTTF
jgi:hypothetical protein